MSNAGCLERTRFMILARRVPTPVCSRAVLMAIPVKISHMVLPAKEQNFLQTLKKVGKGIKDKEKSELS